MPVQTKRQKDRELILSSLRRHIADLQARRELIESDIRLELAKHDVLVEEWALYDRLETQDRRD